MRITVEIPESWSDSIRDYKLFSGPYGKNDQEIHLSKMGNLITAFQNRELPAFHGITMAVKIPKSLLSSSATIPANTNPATPRKPLDWVVNWWNAIPISIAAFLLGMWRKFEKSDKINSNFDLQTHPPEGMSPSEVGTFYDFKVNRRDLISMLPYWGNQGFIKIRPLEGSDVDMYFLKQQDLPSDAPEHERILFTELFNSSDAVLLSDLKNSFYKTMSSVSSKLKKSILEQDLYDDFSNNTLRSPWIAGAGLLSVGFGIFLLIIHAISAGIGMIIIGIFLFVIPFLRPKLSEKGHKNFNHLKGLYHFLKDGDESIMQKAINEDPNYLHFIFPYVLAFDLDKSWMEKIDQFSTLHPPIWYDGFSNQGNQSFSYRETSESFSVRKIEQVFYSTPQPAPGSGSSSGGFSGGFSGGGMGGGSTSSW